MARIGGRQKGTPNKSTKNVRELLEKAAPKLIAKAVQLALEGDRVILNKLLDKIAPSMQAIVQELDVTSIPEFKVNVKKCRK